MTYIPFENQLQNDFASTMKKIPTLIKNLTGTILMQPSGGSLMHTGKFNERK